MLYQAKARFISTFCLNCSSGREIFSAWQVDFLDPGSQVPRYQLRPPCVTIRFIHRAAANTRSFFAPVCGLLRRRHTSTLGMTDKKSRLHISPFTPDLAQSIAPSYASLTAKTISYHHVETFPEKNYAFVELSSMEAEKLKKKLHGSILRGKKLRVEDARPQKRSYDPQDEREHGGSRAKQRKTLTGNSTAGDLELHGHQLSPERKIKRGWTETGRGQQECLFRTHMPPNRQVEPPNSTKAGNERSKTKPKTKKKSRTTIVHEFDKSIVEPGFIRQEKGTIEDGTSAEFIENKGWVNQDGDLVEPVSQRQMRYQKRANEGTAQHGLLNSTSFPHAKSVHGSQDTNGRDPLTKVSLPRVRSEKPKSDLGLMKDAVDEKTLTSSSGTSSSSEESSSASETESDAISQHDNQKEEAGQSASQAGQNDETAVHPLEALFKMPKQAASRTNSKRPLEIKTSFNFFEPDRETNVPQTPFTAKDLQSRGLRSAAPTPDTALPTRHFFAESVSPSGNVASEEQVQSEKASRGIMSSTDGDRESGFTAWFWQHRGDNNRAWKGRRREVIKENRQRENKERDKRQKERRCV